MMFRKAERRQAKLRLALCGPSGSGKTYSALLIAQGLVPGGQIALIDSERGSGELYADLTPYDVSPLQPPYTPARYVERIRQAEHDGYDVLIVDSLTHAWSGVGGILEMHDQATAASRSGNSFTAWSEVTPKHNQLVDALLGVDLHVIVTIRTKTAYDVVDDGKGKKKPIKVGLAPVQRDGLEYEFTTVLDLAVESHVATATKDRTGRFRRPALHPHGRHGHALAHVAGQRRGAPGRPPPGLAGAAPTGGVRDGDARASDALVASTPSRDRLAHAGGARGAHRAVQ